MNKLVLPVGIASTFLGALLTVRLVQSFACYNQQLLSCPDNFLLQWSGLPLLLVGIVLVACSVIKRSHLQSVNRETTK